MVELAEIRSNVHQHVMAMECCHLCGMVTEDWECLTDRERPGKYIYGPFCEPCACQTRDKHPSLITITIDGEILDEKPSRTLRGLLERWQARAEGGE